MWKIGLKPEITFSLYAYLYDNVEDTWGAKAKGFIKGQNSSEQFQMSTYNHIWNSAQYKTLSKSFLTSRLFTIDSSPKKSWHAMAICLKNWAHIQN